MKFLCAFLVPLFCFCALFIPSADAAYIGTEESYYIEMETSQLGTIKVWIPSNYATYVQFQETNPFVINGGSSSFTGFLETAGTAANNDQIRFPSFANPEYRTDNYNIYYELNVIRIVDSNLPGYIYGTAGVTDSSAFILLVFACVVLFFIFVVLVVRRH